MGRIAATRAERPPSHRWIAESSAAETGEQHLAGDVVIDRFAACGLILRHADVFEQRRPFDRSRSRGVDRRLAVLWDHENLPTVAFRLRRMRRATRAAALRQ